jgi:hypothetical protein
VVLPARKAPVKPPDFYEAFTIGESEADDYGHTAAMRLFSLAIVLALAFAAPAFARHGGDNTARGIVQAVAPAALTLRTLDGKVVVARVDRRTAVRIDNRKGTLRDVAPGFVVAVKLDGDVARRVDAYRATPAVAPAPAATPAPPIAADDGGGKRGKRSPSR